MSSSPAKPIALYRSLADLPATTRGAVLAIGNFDGVHFGHQQVIADARALAEAKDAPLGVM
jgi:riboflavin kinase/FMN adenylyltransferase